MQRQSSSGVVAITENKKVATVQHPELDKLDVIFLNRINNSPNRPAQAIKTDVANIIAAVEVIGNNIGTLDGNALLVESYNQKLIELYKKVRFMEMEANQKQNAFGVGGFIKLKISNIRPAVDIIPVVEAIAVPAPESAPVLPPKPQSESLLKSKKVLTPKGMNEKFNELVDSLGLENGATLKKNFREARYFLSAARLVRNAASPSNEVISASAIADKLRDEQQDRKSLIKEVSKAEQIHKLLVTLAANNPNPAVFNEVVAGLNHHLNRMQADAIRMVDMVIQANILALKMHPVPEVVQGIVISINDRSELQHAIINGETDKAMVIIRNGLVDLDHQDSEKNTALHLAVENRNEAIVKALLQKGANKRIENAEGLTAVALVRQMMDNRLFTEKPQGKVGDGTKSHSQLEEINDMLTRPGKMQLINDQEATIQPTKKIPTLKDIAKKYVKLFTGNTNNVAFSGAMNPIEIGRVVINTSYAEKNATNFKEFEKPAIRKILNPFTAVNAVLLAVNLGLRTLVDVIDSAISGNGKTSSVGAIVIKSILTAPLNIAQTIVSGIGDAINVGVENAISKYKTTQENKVVTAVKADVRESSALVFDQLGAKPSANFNHTEVSAAKVEKEINVVDNEVVSKKSEDKNTRAIEPVVISRSNKH